MSATVAAVAIVGPKAWERIKRSDEAQWSRIHSLEKTVSDLERVILNLKGSPSDAQGARAAKAGAP